MWHEARKQEKFIRNVMVDVKKRAERRKVFYEKIKLDPIRFLRLYGSKYKVSMEPEAAIAAENPSTLMVWSGDNETVIDRFDARTNLDCIIGTREKRNDSDERVHERMCNYERFRCLVHNQFAKVSESISLSQIDMVEKYGEDIHKLETKEGKKKSSDKAAIGYVYADTDYVHTGSNSDNDSDSQDSEPDLEMDLDIELDISRLSIPQQKELLKLSHQYGMHGNDYLKLMKLDKNHEEDLRTAKVLEEQKAQFHGRKSRRERKIFKEQRLKERYMKHDPRTLGFGASSFREELYVGKHVLTPSPARDSKSASKSPDNSRRVSEQSRSLKDFVNVPTLRYARDRSRSRSCGYRQSPSPTYGPSNKDARKMSSYRDKMDNRDRRRTHNDRHSRSSERTTRINRDYANRADQDKTTSHNYRLSKSRSPQLPDEVILKKKYYHSDPEEEKSSDSSSNSSDDHPPMKDKSGRKEFHHKKSQQNHSNKTGNNKFNPKDLLKKQMDIQLNRAYRADKKAEHEKQQKVEKERQDRENQLKEMASQIRKRELERRRQEREKSRSRSASRSRSRSSSSSSSSSSTSRSDRKRARDVSTDRYQQQPSPPRSRSRDRTRYFYGH